MPGTQDIAIRYHYSYRIGLAEDIPLATVPSASARISPSAYPILKNGVTFPHSAEIPCVCTPSASLGKLPQSRLQDKAGLAKQVAILVYLSGIFSY